MKVEKGMKYEAPEVEVLAVEVEVGFAGSLVDPPKDGSVGDIEIPEGF